MKGEPGAPIFLIGFMGAGKTTVGRLLARNIDYSFIDLDELIEAGAGKSVREIFAQLGESDFRRLESEALKIASRTTRTVIALGGGAYLAEANRAIIERTGVTIWLDCALEVCLSRVERDGSRPLLASEEEMNRLLDKRRPVYALADHTVCTGDCTAEVAADRVIAALKKSL